MKSRARQLSRRITTRRPRPRTTRVSQTPRMTCVRTRSGPPRAIVQLLRPMCTGRKGTRMPLPLTATRTAARSPRTAAEIVVRDGEIILRIPEQPAPASDAAARHARARRRSIPERYADDAERRYRTRRYTARMLPPVTTSDGAGHLDFSNGSAALNVPARESHVALPGGANDGDLHFETSSVR